jgi:hypothetical protein
MASRVMPASAPVSRRSSPISRLTRVDLPGAVLGLGRLALPRRDLRLMRFEEAAQRVIELAEPEAVLGRERQRLA